MLTMKNGFLAVVLLVAASARAQNAPATPAPLPIRQVTLFTSGVSYIERQGEVDGDATIPLLFRTGQINDILKSMVLLDAQGQVQPVTYGARDPIGRTLQAFAIDVTQPLSRAELLNRLRGVRVSVETTKGETLTGQIVGVEERVEIVGERPVTLQTLNLMIDKGLVSVGLAEIKTLRLLDERLDREFREALRTLASGADDQRREVTLRFVGRGRRAVRVGYIAEAPLWKVSYRLVLRDSEEGDSARPQAKPYLQGWAMVENTTDDDWQNVRLSLVSGRPVSFIQDLYQPLYLPRPVVAPDVVASPYPQTHGANLENEALAADAVLRVTGTSESVTMNLRNAPIRQALEQLFGLANVEYNLDDTVQGTATLQVSGVSFDVALRNLIRQANPPLTYSRESNVFQVRPRVFASPASMPASPSPSALARGARQERAANEFGATSAADKAGNFGVVNGNLGAALAAGKSVVAQASGETAGELFQYNITTPVTLPRQQAAMIPVVAQDIDGEKVSLFNADTGGRFPLNAVRVKNTTTLHLKGGPVTLFDGGVYAGDAKMEDIPPGDNRLMSYAVDLAIEGERKNSDTSFETSLALRRGVLTASRRERRETTYTFKSKSDKPRTVLVEHPFDNNYKLVEPTTPVERTASLYRFAVAVAPRKSQTLSVVVERPVAQTIAVLDEDLESLAYTANRRDIPPRIREGLQEVVQRRRRVQELKAQIANRQAEVDAIGQDQERIRKNMTALDKNSALYKRYVGELDRQETRIQNLRIEIQRLRGEAAEADRDLRAFVDNLNLS